jgi:hypothetical protein
MLLRTHYIAMRYNKHMAKNLQLEDQLRLRNLAEFRYELRRFLQFSEGCAAEAVKLSHRWLTEYCSLREELGFLTISREWACG